MKIVDFQEIQTQIVGVEGEHDDHLTTTTTHSGKKLRIIFYDNT